jgi:fumarate reductase flavoprotein subunit
MAEQRTYDVVVVGGGIAGLAAANRAAELGLTVALLERGTGEQYLCNSRFSGGVLHVAFQNVKNDPNRLLEAIQSATRGRADPELARALAQTSGRAVDWLRGEGAKYIRMSLVIDWQRFILAPPRRIMAGADWQGRGPDYTLRTLAKTFAARGGTIHQGTEAVALMERGGACVGIETRGTLGSMQLLADAVVLADGGFQGNLNLVRQTICAAPEKLKQRGAATGIGDGMRMAQGLGAAVADLSYFYGHVLSRDAFTNDKTWPYPQLDELGIAGIMVDGSGRRFADEGRGGVALANTIAKLSDPLATWAIFDQEIWDGPGRGARIPANPHLERAGGTILKADTLRELAAKAGLPPDALEATVSEYRRAVAAADLAKLDPPRTNPAGNLRLIDQAPFYAAPTCAGITYTMGGIVIDEHGRVRRTSGESIAGLYAAGATTAGLEGCGAPTYVGGLMKGLVFGLRAAEHAASSRGTRL